jgi:hypothetical protein
VQIYKEYKEKLPCCGISEAQLKVHIRQTKAELKTGASDDSSGKAVLQPETLITSKLQICTNFLKLQEVAAN